MASSSGTKDVRASESTPSGSASTSEWQSSRREEQLARREVLLLHPQDPRAFAALHPHQRPSSLPYPLNLPPSYSTYLSSLPAAAAGTRGQQLQQPQPPPGLRQSASFPSTQYSNRTFARAEADARARNAQSAPFPRGRGTGSLDAFMDSHGARPVRASEASDSDSEVTIRHLSKVPPHSDDYPLSDSSVLPSSSTPSSSPLKTPNESSPLRPIYEYASSPTPKYPMQQASDLPYVLPPGPYSHQKPARSLSAMIGQALSASRSGPLTLTDIYTYLSTVYPYYSRGDQSWMSSIRHNLSFQEAFEKVPEDEIRNTGHGRRAKGRGRVGLWRIKPGYEGCFVGGDFIKKGARGAGSGNYNRKRRREPDGECNDNGLKAEQVLAITPSSSTPRPRPLSPAVDLRRHSPSLITAQSTGFSGALPPHDFILSSPSSSLGEHDKLSISNPDSPDLPLSLSLAAAHRNGCRIPSSSKSGSFLEPGFELLDDMGAEYQGSPQPHVAKKPRIEGDKDASHSRSHQTSANPARLLFPTFSSAPRTPPRDSAHATSSAAARSPSRNAASTSPSRGDSSPRISNAHLRWRPTAVNRTRVEWRRTPPPPPSRQESDDLDKETTSTPKRPAQASPFRTPKRPTGGRRLRGYDPYDPDALLADELARVRNAGHPQEESPGGIFGKEGRSLLYDSPGVPSRSVWRFRDELL